MGEGGIPLGGLANRELRTYIYIYTDKCVYVNRYVSMYVEMYT